MIRIFKWTLGVIGTVVGAFLAASAIMSIPSHTINDLENPLDVNNLHRIDADPDSGFAIYRLGEPTEADIASLCQLGIEEIAVFSGTATEVEGRYEAACPELSVVYNVDHDSREPLTIEFLDAFDAWVSSAKAVGRKIAFRCNSGSHRTGRVAAYYQMKYRALSAKDAWDLAQSRGQVMHIVDKYSGLQQQIITLSEYINDKSCSLRDYCVLSKAADSAIPCADPLSGCGWLSAEHL